VVELVVEQRRREQSRRGEQLLVARFGEDDRDVLPNEEGIERCVTLRVVAGTCRSVTGDM
jgi:hypothetical protein